VPLIALGLGPTAKFGFSQLSAVAGSRRDSSASIKSMPIFLPASPPENQPVVVSVGAAASLVYFGMQWAIIARSKYLKLR
jgi:hypothetical protein